MFHKLGARSPWAVLAILLSLASPVAAADAGKAVTPVIVVVDIQAAQRDSLAAKAVRTQRDQYMQKYQSELESGRAALKQTEEEMVKQKAVLSAEAWQQKARAFEQQVADFNRRYQGIMQAVDKSYRTAMNEVMTAFVQVTEEVAGEAGANVVLQKQQVFLHDPRMEVTQTVVERLNKKLATVNFPAPVVEGEGPAQPKAGGKSGKK